MMTLGYDKPLYLLAFVHRDVIDAYRGAAPAIECGPE
jgi:hypothetical protein